MGQKKKYDLWNQTKLRFEPVTMSWNVRHYLKVI